MNKAGSKMKSNYDKVRRLVRKNDLKDEQDQSKMIKIIDLLSKIENNKSVGNKLAESKQKSKGPQKDKNKSSLEVRIINWVDTAVEVTHAIVQQGWQPTTKQPIIKMKSFLKNYY